MYVWIVATSSVFARLAFFVGLLHYSRDPQVFFFIEKTTLKLGPTVLFTHLKIILLQCFQFSAMNDIQTDPKCTFKKIDEINIICVW